ncbi:MAG TPA: D-alanyl-D-alanine carboxypeptidase [Gammaproteobacteria bacterium]|nr:D-alanyl-D-alanine carboxypeptidase [Gammaproteobacteria bacterium]
MIRKVFYFFFSLALSFLLSGNESFIPDPPSISSSNYILIDANTNRVLAEMNPDEEIEPASITKIMTGYVVSDQIQEGFITLDDEVLISENCWRKKGSRMFIEEGSRVVLLDLIKGMVIQSGNDATCAIAEHVAGSEDNFVDLMMRYAEKMALDNTSFINPSGWPDTDHYSSAKDIAKLSTLLIKDFPEHYSLYKEKWFTYNNIRQRNRNALLWQDDSIDGLKTGHTESAGFCLVSSGTREQTRLIAVTLKSKSEKTRLTDNRRLLDYGFRYFRTKKLVTEGQNVKEEQVWGGELEKVAIAPIQDFYLTLPLRDFKKIESFVSLEDYLQAPISKNQIVGKMLFKLGEEEVGSVDLVTVKEVKSQGVFGRAWSNIKLLVYRFLMEEE